MVFAELSDTNCVGILLSDFEHRPKRGSHFVLIHVLGGSTCSFNPLYAIINDACITRITEFIDRHATRT